MKELVKSFKSDNLSAKAKGTTFVAENSFGLTCTVKQAKNGGIKVSIKKGGKVVASEKVDAANKSRLLRAFRVMGQ